MATELVVCTFNVAMLWTLVNTDRAWKIYNLMSSKYDICGLQEAFGAAPYFKGHKSIPAVDEWGPLWRLPRLYAVSSGLVTLSSSKHPIVDSGSMLLERGLLSDWLCPKSVQWSCIDVNGEGGGIHLHVFNTHLQADYRLVAEHQKTRRQFQEVCAYIASILRAHRGHALILGDMNMNARNEMHETFFQETLHQYIDSFGNHTTESLGSPYENDTHENGWHVDRIVIVHDNRISSSSRISASNYRIVPDEKYSLSDHLAVEARITLQQ